MVCASIFCRMVVPILFLRWERWLNAVEEGSLIMQPYRSYFVGPMTKYSELVTYAESVHHVWCPFSALRIVLLYKVAFA